MKLRTLVSAAVVAAFATAAHADIVLDDFNLPNTSAQTVSSGFGVEGNGVTYNNTYGSAVGILGGYRTLDVTCVSGCDTGTERGATVTVEGGELAWSNSTGVRSNAGVSWDANGAGLNANLWDLGTTIVATVLEADLGFNYVLTLFSDSTNYTTLTSGTVNAVVDGAPESSSYSLSWWALADGFYFLDGLPFDIAHAGTGVDLTNVNKIDFRMNNVGECFTTPGENCSTAVDLRIDQISVVSEPASLALAGLALMAAGVASRRGRAAKA